MSTSKERADAVLSRVKANWDNLSAPDEEARNSRQVERAWLRRQIKWQRGKEKQKLYKD